jgi:hypothetical protein
LAEHNFIAGRSALGNRESKMKGYRLHGLTKFTSVAGIALFALAVLWPFTFPASAQPPESGGSHAAVPATSAGNPGTSSGLQATKPQAAPNAAPRPFLRLIAVLFSGLVISAARLARKFRRFWGLGVFANPYAVLFLIFGVGLCGISVASESAVSSLPGLTFLGPWIADASGIVLTLVLPAIRFKRQARSAGDSPVRDLDAPSSSNPILAVIEDAIRDRILARMQSEIAAASRRYDWDTIKLASRRLLEEEMTIGRVGREDGDAALRSVEAFQAVADARVDSSNKYAALVRLLGWCPFSRLRDSLAAAGGTQA